MKKFRYQSLVGICLIFLFLVNIALIIAGLVTAEILLIAAGIILSVLQVLLHRLFERKAGVWRPDSLSSLIYQYVKSTSPGLAERLFSRDDGLLRREEKELILNRSHNIPTEVMSYKIQDNWGSQWLKQKDSPSSIPQRELRVAIGNQQCSQPYDASILNIGYTWQSEASGDLAFVLSEGCRIGGFAISTGLSGITPALIRGGGDLVWQIPFASGELSGGFNEAMFERYSGRCYVKMIEVVVSDPFISCSRAVGTDSNLISKKWHQSTWFLEDVKPCEK